MAKRKLKLRKKNRNPKKRGAQSARKKKGPSRKRQGRKKTVSRSPSLKKTRVNPEGSAKSAKAKLSLAVPGGTLVGTVTHYFSHVHAAVVKIRKGKIRLNDTLHFKGHTTDFKQIVASLQKDHVPIESAQKGEEVGVGVDERVREGDKVYRVAL